MRKTMIQSVGAIAWSLVYVGALPAQVERIWLTHKSPAPDHVVINWETAQPGNSVVRFGPTPELGQSRTVEENVTLHHVEIPLAPGPLRCYYVRI